MDDDLSPEEAAKAIEVPVREWPGNCWYICEWLLETDLLPDGSTHKRGRYTGALIYGKYRAEILAWSDDIGSRRHSWIETPDGTVVDPTRYVFEGVEPYIYKGARDNYVEEQGALI
jgi:hypothetical protein